MALQEAGRGSQGDADVTEPGLKPAPPRHAPPPLEAAYEGEDHAANSF